MRFTATTLNRYYRPTPCQLRAVLFLQGEVGAPPSPYQEVLRRLGIRHELAHLATFPVFEDLSRLNPEEAAEQTVALLQAGALVIYQGCFISRGDLGGTAREIIGRPDFLIRANSGGYIIRDAKLSRRITVEDHPEIFTQMDLYEWLLDEVFGHASAVEVLSGTGEIVPVPVTGGFTVMPLFEKILALLAEPSPPYEPVGWTKCGACAFKATCWGQAEQSRDVALVRGVDQGLARALHGIGVETLDDLVERFTPGRLADFERPWGERQQRVGDRLAGAILLNARAMVEGKHICLSPPNLPDVPNYVMFDLEGMPPHLDETDKIYLWGVQVYGEEQGEYQAALAGFGSDGDLAGWEQFLDLAGSIFEVHGDIPFVHYAAYEKTHVKMYMERYGDRGGVAARVLQNLLDLHPVLNASFALPLPSLSLKVVEGYVGFERTQEEFGGDWSMAKYIEATEFGEGAERDRVMAEVLTYNEEDLAATWAVFEWICRGGR